MKLKINFSGLNSVIFIKFQSLNLDNSLKQFIFYKLSKLRNQNLLLTIQCLTASAPPNCDKTRSPFDQVKYVKYFKMKIEKLKTIINSCHPFQFQIECVSNVASSIITNFFFRKLMKSLLRLMFVNLWIRGITG